jgi:phosphatidate cytidylyltransferase
MQDAPKSPTSSGKMRTLAERSFSTVILLGVFLGAIYWGNSWTYGLIVWLLCALTSLEWGHMLRSVKHPSHPLLSTVVGILYPLLIIGAFACPVLSSGFQTALIIALLSPAVLAIISFIWEMRRPIEGDRAMASVSTTLLSFIYPVWMFAFALPLLLLQQEGCHSVALVVWVGVITKCSDIFAYCSGLLMGGRFFTKKLIPHISPKKTWEGLIGSYILTVAFALLLGHWMGIALVENVGIGVIAATVIFVLSVTGDLAGSLIKRSLAIKDSGSLLPGIGGIFDLIDSLAFTMPVAYLYHVLTVGI